jgi:hypothetical protein
MKLRMRGSSLRLRLTKTEVEHLAGDPGVVTETVSFGRAATLTYRIRRAEVPAVAASLKGTTIDVVAPLAIIDAWASSDEVGFEAKQSVGGADVLSILVEKDWSCLVPRAGENDADAFPHPKA